MRTRLPEVDENASDFNAYERLLEAKHTMQIPRAEGDADLGRKLYRRECASCHGRDGWGDLEEAVPMLTGQYTNYLWRQVKKYREGIRIHDPGNPDEKLLLEFSDLELKNIFAFISIADD